jgi:O-antigen biosynthesis protein
MSLTTSVIICAYTQNRWSQLLSAAESVRKQTTPVAEVLLVVDHNEELLSQAQAAMSWARVIPSTGVPGLSGARNTGVAASIGEIVLFLDDDAVAEADWVGNLVAAYRDPQVLGVGGAANPVWERSAPRWWPAEFGWVVGCSYRGQPVSTAPVRNLMGCNMSLRRTVLEAVGGFDDGLGRGAGNAFGCEETELCIRARQLIPNGEFIFEPRAVVRHWVPQSRSSWSYFLQRCRAEGISKARVAATVGRSAALSEEKAYTRRVLSTGIARNIRDGVAGDLAALARTGAIAIGASLAALGFLGAKAGRRRRVQSDTSESDGRSVAATVPPAIPLIVNLDEPLPAIEAWRKRDGVRYATAHCLVILDGDPVGRARLDLSSGSLTPQQVADQLWEHLGEQIINHRQCTSRPALQNLPAHGLVSSGRSVVFSASPALGAAVVVATKDRPAMLRECLESISRGSVKPERVIVVDNASAGSETAELVRQWAKQEQSVLYVREDEPGLARAHNAALPHMSSPIVAFTDDDVVVDEQWLKRIVQVFADDESVACVTGIIAPRELDTLPQQWVEGNMMYDKGLQRRTFDKSHRSSDPLFPYSAGGFGSGANMAFRASFLRKHDGFDEALGAGTIAMGGDDLAAFYDVISSGNRLVYEPAAIALHQHPRQYAALKRQSYGYGVGLGAHLTRCLLKSPGMALVFLRHAPAVIRRGTDVIRPATVGELPPYPRELSRVRWKGLASGPGRFLFSRWHSRRLGRTT